MKMGETIHRFAYFILTLVNVFSGVVEGDLNLYMNRSETNRLLGVVGELYYVRDNIVNENALNYNVPIPSNVDTIYFTWHDLHSEQHMWFNITAIVSSKNAMHTPKISVGKEGLVPVTLSVFWVELRCTGLVTDHVDIYIILHISLFNASAPRKISIHRTKMCFKGDGTRLGNEIDSRGETKTGEGKDKDSQWLAERGVPASAVVLYMVLTALLCLILLLVAISLACRFNKNNHHAINVGLVQGVTQEETPKSSVVGAPLYASSPYVQMTPQKLDTVLNEIHIDRSHIELGETLMEGSFGKIYRGTLTLETKESGENTMDVCVKTVTEAVSSTQMEVFLRECCLLKGQLHENINPLIATCLETDPLMVFPYLNEGNLKSFLLRSKLSDRGTKQALSTQQLVYIAIQLVRGVEYLHKRHIVHRDIATRNCLVDSQLVVRLGDNALARDLFPADYHCLGDNENRPVKWLSIEALLENNYSYASDVWAFGVAVWEIMTLAQQPYAEVDAFEMDTYLREGYRVSHPLNCPDELFAVMACCWSLIPEERPHVSQLCTCLQDFYTALCQFI